MIVEVGIQPLAGAGDPAMAAWHCSSPELQLPDLLSIPFHDAALHCLADEDDFQRDLHGISSPPGDAARQIPQVGEAALVPSPLVVCGIGADHYQAAAGAAVPPAAAAPQGPMMRMLMSPGPHLVYGSTHVSEEEPAQPASGDDAGSQTCEQLATEPTLVINVSHNKRKRTSRHQPPDEHQQGQAQGTSTKRCRGAAAHLPGADDGSSATSTPAAGAAAAAGTVAAASTGTGAAAAAQTEASAAAVAATSALQVAQQLTARNGVRLGAPPVAEAQRSNRIRGFIMVVQEVLVTDARRKAVFNLGPQMYKFQTAADTAALRKAWKALVQDLAKSARAFCCSLPSRMLLRSEVIHQKLLENPKSCCRPEDNHGHHPGHVGWIQCSPSGSAPEEELAARQASLAIAKQQQARAERYRRSILKCGPNVVAAWKIVQEMLQEVRADRDKHAAQAAAAAAAAEQQQQQLGLLSAAGWPAAVWSGAGGHSGVQAAAAGMGPTTIVVRPQQLHTAPGHGMVPLNSASAAAGPFAAQAAAAAGFDACAAMPGLQGVGLLGQPHGMVADVLAGQDDAQLQLLQYGTGGPSCYGNQAGLSGWPTAVGAVAPVAAQPGWAWPLPVAGGSDQAAAALATLELQEPFVAAAAAAATVAPAPGTSSDVTADTGTATPAVRAPSMLSPGSAGGAPGARSAGVAAAAAPAAIPAAGTIAGEHAAADQAAGLTQQPPTLLRRSGRSTSRLRLNMPSQAAAQRRPAAAAAAVRQRPQRTRNLPPALADHVCDEVADLLVSSISSDDSNNTTVQEVPEADGTVSQPPDEDVDSGAVFAGVYAAVAAEDDGDAYEDGADEDEDEEEINKQYRVSGSGRSLSLAAIRQRFDMSAAKAAKDLGVGNTVFKDFLRMFGIKRWPFRRRQSIRTLIADVQAYRSRRRSAEGTEQLLAELRGLLAHMTRNPNITLDARITRLKSAVSKLKSKRTARANSQAPARGRGPRSPRSPRS